MPFKVSDIILSIVLFIEDETFAVIELRLSEMFVVIVLLEGTGTGVGSNSKTRIVLSQGHTNYSHKQTV